MLLHTTVCFAEARPLPALQTGRDVSVAHLKTLCLRLSDPFLASSWSSPGWRSDWMCSSGKTSREPGRPFTSLPAVPRWQVAAHKSEIFPGQWTTVRHRSHTHECLGKGVQSNTLDLGWTEHCACSVSRLRAPWQLSLPLFPGTRAPSPPASGLPSRILRSPGGPRPTLGAGDVAPPHEPPWSLYSS